MSNSLDLDLDSLSQHLKEHIASFSGISSMQKFSVGQSNPTYLFTSFSGDKYVLRRQPYGDLLKSAHQVDREFRVMSSLPDTPLPKMVYLCEDKSIIGSMFFVMEFVDGEQFIDPALAPVDKLKRKDYYYSAVDTLAGIHNTNLEDNNLLDFGRGSGFFAWQVALWTKQYQASFTDERADMTHLMEWLPANLPEDDGTITLIHGDYKFDNLLFEKDNAKVAAVLDWELSTLGHPISDIAYFCLCLRLPNFDMVRGLAQSDRGELGIPTEQDIVEKYCQQRGIDNIQHWNFYLAFSAFRLASITQGVYFRHLNGNASSDQAARAGEVTNILADIGAKLSG